MALDTKAVKEIEVLRSKARKGELVDGWMQLPTFRGLCHINRLAHLAHMLLALSRSMPCAGLRWTRIPRSFNSVQGRPFR